MVNSALHPRPAARDLALQRHDPRLQFGDGERVEVLANQRGERVARAGQGIVDIHPQQR